VLANRLLDFSISTDSPEALAQKRAQQTNSVTADQSRPASPLPVFEFGRSGRNRRAEVLAALDAGALRRRQVCYMDIHYFPLPLMIAHAILSLTHIFFDKAVSNRIDFSLDEFQPQLISSVFMFDAATKIFVTGPDILEQRYARFFDRFRLAEERAHPGCGCADRLSDDLVGHHAGAGSALLAFNQGA
jgi:hypothetical protein